MIALVEVLSGKRLPKFNKTPKMRAQRLENVNIAISFLKNEENIRIVNVGKLYIFLGSNSTKPARAKLISSLKVRVD